MTGGEESLEINPDLLIRGLYALGTGLLIGLERSVYHENQISAGIKNSGRDEKGHEPEDNFDEPIGVRTFTALSLSGFAAAAVNQYIPNGGPAIFIGLIALIIIYYRETVRSSRGMTTEVAAIATLALGALCYLQPDAAVMLGIFLAILLASKRFTHETIRKMRRVEITDTLKFLVVAFIILPLLPAKPLDPFGAVIPYKIGWLVVLISGISFVGYFLTRIFGTEKGLGLAGFFGGLTSSTAVTAAMSAESKNAPSLKTICAFSTVVANATSFFRILVMATIIDTALASKLVIPIGAMGFSAITASFFLWRSAVNENVSGPGEQESPVKLKNPFSLGPAIKFSVFFVFIILLSKIAKLYYGDLGLYVAAAISGLADVDAITLSVGQQTASGALSTTTGVFAITIAVVSNAIVKILMAMTVGTREFGRLVLYSLGTSVCIGLAFATGLNSSISL